MLTFSDAARPSLHSYPRDGPNDPALCTLHTDHIHQIIDDFLCGGHTSLQSKQTKQEKFSNIFL